MQNLSELTFFIYDYETFGVVPAYDRPAQFAGIRTDRDFNVIGDAMMFYCQPSNDYLPQPEAVLLTGITPQYALQHGVNEATFAKQIHQQFSQPATCIMGYNNIRFDDEVTRYLFYRNFYDPYAYSWQQKNSRWDLLDVVRSCYALRPEGINWPLNDDGLPSFKLEHLTQANQIAHHHSHDAMSDVYATIGLAKLIKQKQPKLFDYLFTLRYKRNVQALIDVVNMTPLVHVSGMFGAHRGNTSWIVPLAWHPTNKNAVIVCDLAGDITPLLTLSIEALNARLYCPASELAPNEKRLPIKLVHINKCPVLAPAKTLTAENAKRLSIDRQSCLQTLQQLRQHPEIRTTLTMLFSQQAHFPSATDVDAQLYDDFFNDADRAACQIILQTAPLNLPALDLTFQDQRIEPLLFRYRARNYPQTLNEEEQKRWLMYRQQKLNQQTLEAYLLHLQQLAQHYTHDEKKWRLIQSLYHYTASL